MHHSTLGWREIKKKKGEASTWAAGYPSAVQSKTGGVEGVRRRLRLSSSTTAISHVCMHFFVSLLSRGVLFLFVACTGVFETRPYDV